MEQVSGSTGRSAKATNFRWLVVGLAFVGMTINYIDRANIGAALPVLSSDLKLNNVQQGLVLSAFFYTYAAFQFFGGWTADHFGPRRTFTLASLWWGAVTAATALATGFGSLFGLRLLLGAGEASAYPACSSAVGRWVAKHERAFATAVYDNGTRVGGALTLPLVMWLISTVGWRQSFVATGVLGIAFALLWVWLYRDPAKHARVNEAELALIHGDAPAHSGADDGRIRWLALLTHRPVWGVMLGSFSMNFIAYFFITWMPTYFAKALHFSLLKTGFTGMLPPLVAVVAGLLGGAFGDFMVKRGVGLTTARKIVIAIGMLCSSAISLAVFAPSPEYAVALLCLSYSGVAFCASNSGSLPMDIAPNKKHVAALMGIQLGSANLAGIIMPVVVGWFLDKENNFSHALMLIGVFGLIGLLAFLVLLDKVEPIRFKPRRQP